MKQIAIFLTFFLYYTHVFAQCDPCDKNDPSLIETIRKKTCDDIEKQATSFDVDSVKDKEYFNIITDRTYNKVLKDEFAEIIIPGNTFSNYNRHASLSFEDNNSKFSFSPINYHNNIKSKALMYYGTINFSGAVDNSQVFKLFDKDGVNRNFKVTGNFNLVLKNKRVFLNVASHKEAYRIFLEKRTCARNKICEKYQELAKADSCKRILDLLDINLCESEELETKIWDEYSEVERKLASPFWVKTVKHWLSFSATPYGYTEFNGFNQKDSSVSSLNYNEWSGKIVYNLLKNYLCTGNALYFNVWGQIGRKSIFSDKKSTKWNQLVKLSDTTQIISDAKDVYNYLPEDYKVKTFFSWGSQFIYMWNFHDKVRIGVDFTYSNEGFPAVKNDKSDYRKKTFTAGLVFPFNDKDGERTINIEPFYSKSSYTTSDFDSEWFIGLKFSVPIFSKQ